METNRLMLGQLREKRREERRNRGNSLLLTAARLFNERGFTATSLDDIAGCLNITKPVVYRYFRSKDQILFECVRIGFEQIRDAATSMLGSPGTGLDRLGAFARHYAEIMTTNFGMCVLRSWDHELSQENHTYYCERKTEVDAIIRKIIEEGIADGSMASRDVNLTIFAVTGALNWIAHWYDPEGPNSPSEIADFFVEFISLGIGPR